MINLVVKKDIKDLRGIVYAFYYLIKNIDSEYAVSFEARKGAINIFYGVKPEGNNSMYIPYLEKDLKAASEVKFLNYKGQVYMALEDFKTDKPYELEDTIILYNYDIIKASLYILSCAEEYNFEGNDSLNRFLGRDSKRKEHIKLPFFDLNSDMLLEGLKMIDSEIKVRHRGFRVLLTHDIDNVDSRNLYIMLHDAKALLLGREEKASSRAYKFINHLAGNSFKAQFEKTMEIERKYGAVSELYFLQGKKGRFGSRYSMKQLDYAKAIIANNKSFVVGLHTNCCSFGVESEMLKEKKVIENYFNSKVTSCRNHYLRFATPDTWINLSRIGIEFDTTLGYSDVNGFRAGTTGCFIPFNLDTDSLINIYEVPMAFMDVVSMEMREGSGDAVGEIKSIVDAIENHQGTCSILWHPDYFEDESYINAYEAMLEYIYGKNGEFITTRQLEREKEADNNNITSLWQSLNI